MTALWVVVAGLGVPGLLPALAVARWSPALIFLAPLVGAVMAGIGAVLEVGVGGSLVACYLTVAILVNLAVVVWWLAAGRLRPWPSPPAVWSLLTAAVIVAALALPLSGLTGHLIGWDTNSIWLTHALMLAGGHHQALADLQNPAYVFSNPDYPPLVPAAGALAFAVLGHTDLQVAVDVTVGLNACALGVAGTAIAALVGRSSRTVARACALAAGAAFCLAGFAVAGSAGIDGHADLLWAAAAVGAIIWGLVLPRSKQALLIAWACAAVASLTKNEGFTTALIVIVLIAFRYLPLKLTWLRSPTRRNTGPGRPELAARQWALRAGLIVVPAVPGLAWAGLARHLGLRDAFFVGSTAGSLSYRAGATVTGLGHYLTIMAVAVAVLAVGSVALRYDRKRAQLANPAWLWAAAIGSLVVIFATYVLGTPPIHWWLNTSGIRTTIFARCVMYAELAVWFVIAVETAFRRGDRAQPTPSPAPARLAAPASTQPDLALQHGQRNGTDHPGGQRQDRAAGHDARYGTG